jgi:opacity protein-like surface antigen
VQKFYRLAFFFLALTPAMIPCALHAQMLLPRANVFLGYSYNHLDFGQGFTRNTNGYEFSGEGQVLPFLGLVADYSGHYGTNHLHEQNFLFGPRVSVSLGPVTPFGQILFGAGHIGAVGSSDTSFAQAVGGGLDYRLTGPVAWRNQIDYLRTGWFGSTQNNVRFSTGLAFRF